MRATGWLLAALGVFCTFPAEAGDVPDPASIVRMTAAVSAERLRRGDDVSITITADIAEGWHINSNTPTFGYLIPTKLDVTAPPGIVLTSVAYPAGTRKTFSFSDAPLDVYETRIVIQAVARVTDIPAGRAVIRLGLKYQACDHEKCLPPATAVVDMPIEVTEGPVAAKPAASRAGEADIARLFEERGSVIALILIFWGGLLLNLTPCVYPMIPVTIAFFGGRAAQGGSKPIGAAIAYFLGIVAAYSILGTVAGLTGGLFGALLSHPVVLIGLACLMLYLAAGMFGWVPFSFPSGFVQKVGGRVPFGPFGMGATMGVAAAPCIGPVIVGLLTYVSTRQSAVVGLTLFSVLAAGMGLPYLFLGIFSGQLRRLPKSGAWMGIVKVCFGLILIGMAVYFVAPLLPSDADDSFWLPYDPVSYDSAAAAGQPILLDFYAEWCAPCKKLDRTVYADPRVRSALEDVVRLKVDLTEYEAPASAAVRRKFEVSGVPTQIYLDTAGRERIRFHGEFPPEVLLNALEEISR